MVNEYWQQDNGNNSMSTLNLTIYDKNGQVVRCHTDMLPNDEVHWRNVFVANSWQEPTGGFHLHRPHATVDQIKDVLHYVYFFYLEIHPSKMNMSHLGALQHVAIGLHIDTLVSQLTQLMSTLPPSGTIPSEKSWNDKVQSPQPIKLSESLEELFSSFGIE